MVASEKAWPDEMPAKPKNCSRRSRAGVSPLTAIADNYSTFFLRRSTMIPKNRTANVPQTIRTMEVSIVSLLS